MINVSDLIRRALRSEATAKQNHLQVNVLFNKDVDLSKAIGLTSADVNESWAPTLEELIKDGWTLIRVQTEFGINGHYTMAYFAKF